MGVGSIGGSGVEGGGSGNNGDMDLGGWFVYGAYLFVGGSVFCESNALNAPIANRAAPNSNSAILE